MAVVQEQMCKLTRRFRRQASSHIGFAVFWELGSAIASLYSETPNDQRSLSARNAR